MKKKKILIVIAGFSFLVSFGIQSFYAFATSPYQKLENKKILEMNFESNFKNSVNNKVYNSQSNKSKFVSGAKGLGFSPLEDRVIVPKTDLNISNENTITVSFKYRYGGEDTNQMIMSFGNYSLYHSEGRIAFNTGNGDLYGLYYNPPTDKFITITAEFNKKDITKNKLYIDGVKQNIKHTNSNRPQQIVLDTAFSEDLNIAGWSNHTGIYPISDNTIIDEFVLLKGSSTQEEVTDLANSHRVPDLYVDKDSSGVKLNWATEILDEDVLYRTGFENGDDISQTANQGANSISSNSSYTGDKSLKVTNSLVHGNNGHGDGSVSARYDFNTTYGLDVGMKFSASAKLKNTENVPINVAMAARGGYPKDTRDWHIVYGGQPIIVGEDTSKTPGRLVIENFDYFYNKLHPEHMNFIATKKGTDYDKDAYRVIIYKNQVDVSTKSITGLPSSMSYKKGDILQHIDSVYPLSLNANKIEGDSTWRNYNFNGEIYDYNYDVPTRGLIPYINFRNSKDMYIDDIKFGYATMVEVFRNNAPIYKGYGSEFKDTFATDKEAPDSINQSTVNIDTTINSNDIRNINMSFIAPMDKGSNYSYEARSITKSGVPTSKTKPIVINQTSGVKGYSYVIDKSPSTNPDNTVDTTSTSINKSFNKDESGLYYLHTKPIDNKGNAGVTSHIKIDVPILETTPVIKENAIKLNWDIYGNENIFKVFKKGEEESEYQSISLINLENAEPVNVLLVYPSTTCSLTTLPTTTYTDVNGKSITIPISANLKKWMEEPKPDAPLGYGRGLIKVDVVEIDNYNSNPNKYLKNSNGEYQYDVLTFGIADCNGSKGLTANSRIETEKFVETGRGLFLGHDTVYTNETRIEFANLAEKYMGMTVNPSNGKYYRDENIKIVKKGLLTEFPWDIGDVGDILNVPVSHTSYQVPTSRSNTWLEYANGKSEVENFYLTTSNNLAMSQTGHSTGMATEDEQKLLANVMFYLKQLSSSTEFIDKSSMDLKAPTMPTVKSSSLWDSLTFSIAESVDSGSKYKFYVESSHKNGHEKTISNIKEETITTGVKGYSYIVDTSPTTIPDNTVDTTKTTVTTSYPANQENVYIHIKAIDNVGNESETHHYKLPDTKKPVVSINGANKNWTNANQNITITATDEGSGVNKIEYNLTGATKKDWGVYSNVFTISNEGITYISARAYDNMGNLSNEIKVDVKIDKTKPINNKIEIVS